MKLSLLVATCTAARVDHPRKETDQHQICPEQVAQRCPGDWKYHGNGTSGTCWCVSGSPVLCKGGGGDWKYRGNYECVTTKRFAQCATGTKQFCKAPWDYIGLETCCLASDVEFTFTAVKGGAVGGGENYCKGDWTYLGDTTCVTFKKDVACKEKSYYSCKSPWTYVGHNNCCLVSASMQSSASVVAIILSLCALHAL